MRNTSILIGLVAALFVMDALLFESRCRVIALGQVYHYGQRFNDEIEYGLRRYGPGSSAPNGGSLELAGSA
jgi:hypothetical protein